MKDKITKILTHPTVSLVLTLLLLFQWYNQYAKELSIKNNLLAMRRILELRTDINKTNDDNLILKEMLDSTLATVGARRPFEEEGKKVLTSVIESLKEISNMKIKKPNEEKE